jgi:hypothetical protein
VTQVNQPIALPPPTRCSDKCPFCETQELLNYHTKNGALKKERVLAKHLRSADEITSDSVGNVYPTPGGGDPTKGWLVAANILETFPVEIAAAPHHLIPGKASMAPSTLETWTLESKGKIKQDIGYNIDCAENGIFLPHLPEIYWTRYQPGTETPMSEYFGQTWTDLSPSAKQSIGDLVMNETELQMHYTDHDDPYAHVDNETNYDDECKQECNQLADMMQAFADVAKCQDDDGKLNPPYALVHRINGKSRAVKLRITGSPRRWQSWVSPLAQELTHTLQSTNAKLSVWRGIISRI